MVETVTPWQIWTATGIAFVFTLFYIVTHAAGLIRLIRMKDSEPGSKLAGAAWIVSFVGGFTGPCVILASIAAIIMGLISLHGEVSEKTRLCAHTAILASSLIVAMTLTMVALILSAY
jgi:hypothetical protein